MDKRLNLLARYLKKYLTSGTEQAVVYLRGETLRQRPGTDVDLPFRQESFFHYASAGLLPHQPDAHLLCRLGHQDSSSVSLSIEETIVFIPRVSADDQVWHGAPPTQQEWTDRLNSTKSSMVKVQYADQLASVLDSFGSSKQSMQFYCLNAEEADCLRKITSATTTIDTESLREALIECRLRKAEDELECMRRANRLSSESHRSLMQFVASSYRNAASQFTEQTVTARWYAETMQRGLMQQAYLPIVAYGKHAAVLHYTDNHAPIPTAATVRLPESSPSFLLVDAGAEFNCYAADITRTYPINGRFDTPEKRRLYSLVLDAQTQVLAALRAGVHWEDMHRLATEVIAGGLLDAGILRKPPSSGGDATMDRQQFIQFLCWQRFVTQLFFPHGLGHLIGLDVHDCGGYPLGVERIQQPGIRYLRMRRQLEAGFVVTVEPGCYFVDQLLEPALQDPSLSQFIDQAVLDRYRALGGVRIEDVVVITASGHENLVSAPKQIAEIEAVMATC